LVAFVVPLADLTELADAAAASTKTVVKKEWNGPVVLPE
jgi:hypothetical protein